MNRKTISFLRAVLLACTLLLLSVSCSTNTRDVESLESPSILDTKKDGIELRGALEELESVDPVALEYCNNIKAIMYGTDAFQRPIAPTLDEESDVSDIETQVNPISLKLQSLIIENEETNESLDFFNLSLDEKRVFVDLLLASEAKMVSEKINKYPELKAILEAENRATSKLITRYKIPSQDVGVIAPANLRSSDEDGIDQEAFFNELAAEIATEVEAVNGEGSSESGLRGIGGTIGDYPRLDVSKVLAKWRATARRGDVILALPKHYMSGILYNPGNPRFKVGHAGILNKKIYPTTKEIDNITIECWEEVGVREKKVINWDVPHYILGIQKVKWVWRWRGFRSGLYKEVTPVSNPYVLADWAKKYIGHEYIKRIEHPIAKWIAPKRFTCTTLVWWCAKKAYDVNVSSWYSPLVTPSDIFLDSSIYIRADVYGL
ncbi:MAG: hypothetical protein PUK66_04125 [Bacteroidales bacterium]|uniref:hypothetical protein n=1 Tax=Porphyromonas sp. TaxID=1924944 RepID=UPI0029725D7B|nr:hypothetical protein [Porphyromonas sp.]MDD7438011.1 hypothetical protein [Bacteroidales bacterium]MDY3067349.1 hypothetical protein [Porphyromonas sp.]